MSKIAEFYGFSTLLGEEINWGQVVEKQNCPFLNRKCIKVRKSEPSITIGSCSVFYSDFENPIIICPFRLLENRQIFSDCIHLLTLHQPGNELHILPEISIPGGNVDYFLVSARDGKVKDFVGVELQTMDTTGTVWPERQKLLREKGLEAGEPSSKSFGMNWKMTAKTILIQLHHKVETFETINKHLALVIQDNFLNYIRKEFRFDHLETARIGDPMHIHSYQVSQLPNKQFKLRLQDRYSTDTEGIAELLGLKVSPKVELEEIIKILEARISADTTYLPIKMQI